MFNKKGVFLLITIAAMLAVVSGVYAAHVTINTNDGAVDDNWVNVSLIINDGADTAANYDIVDAWVGNTADYSTFYFRANLAGTGQLPNDYSILEARLDCSQPANDSFQDAEDVVVYYALDTWLPGGEEVMECQGSDYIDCDYLPEPNNSDTNPLTSGEEIAGSPYNYEWQADTASGDTDWSACLVGTFNVQFASVDASGVMQDITAWLPYSAPNAVTLSSITAQNMMPITAIVLGITAAGGLIVIRKKTKGE